MHGPGARAHYVIVFQHSARSIALKFHVKQQQNIYICMYVSHPGLKKKVHSAILFIFILLIFLGALENPKLAL